MSKIRAMTHKERFRTVLRRQAPDRIPFVARLDLWYNAAKSAGELPGDVERLTIPQIEARLGMGRSARFNTFFDVTFEGAEKEEVTEGTTVRTTWRIGGRSVEQRYALAAGHAQGVRGHIIKYFAKTAEDYETLRRLWERARWTFRPEAFDDFCKTIGDDGFPMIVAGVSPIHSIMLLYAGYENFYLHLADFPAKVEALLRVMEKQYEQLWQALASSSAELVLHGAHWSTQMTPPPIFRKYFLPYFQRFTQAMHAAGKQAAFHGDADLSGLLREVSGSGMDVADCFACAPLVPLELSEARRTWKERVVVWGGIPSTILLPSCPVREFRNYLDRLLAEVADGRAIIAAVSDNLMPQSEWGRLQELAERIGSLKIG